MQMVPPFWFVQRQGKAEPAGDNAYRLTAPNLKEAFISIRKSERGGWTAALRPNADGTEVAVSEHDYEDPQDAWGAAFELYRNALVT